MRYYEPLYACEPGKVPGTRNSGEETLLLLSWSTLDFNIDDDSRKTTQCDCQVPLFITGKQYV